MGNGVSSEKSGMGKVKAAKDVIDVTHYMREDPRFAPVNVVEQPVEATRKKRSILSSFVKWRRLSNLSALRALRNETTTEDDIKKTIFVEEAESASQYTNEDSPEQDSELLKCALCKGVTIFESHSCRVCERTFHRACLKKSGHYSRGELDVIDKLEFSVGWSCYDCHTLSQLLPAEDVTAMYDEFDHCDFNKDHSITLVEYLAYRDKAYRFKHHNHPLPPIVEKEAGVDFVNMDTDHSGTIDWREFLNHEAGKRLTKLKKDELVGLLTPPEISLIRKFFEMLDEDCSGAVETREARRQLLAWYNKEGSNECPRRRMSIMNRFLGNSLDGILDDQLRLFSETADENDGVINWKPFLRSQALTVIRNRPNKQLRPSMCAGANDAPIAVRRVSVDSTGTATDEGDGHKKHRIIRKQPRNPNHAVLFHLLKQPMEENGGRQQTVVHK